LDFPCIWFCKHIGAIYFHFPHLCPAASVPAASPVPSPCEPAPDKEPKAAAKNTFHSLVQDVNMLSHRLISEEQELPLAVVKAVQSAKVSLTAATAAIASTTGSSGSTPLPPKQKITPNQHSWTETAKTMGVKKAPKRCKLPEEEGVMQKAIGAPKGKHHRVYTDPYAGGERPGKLAKADALSATANRNWKARAPVPPVLQPIPGAAPTFPPSCVPSTLPSFPTSSLPPGSHFYTYPPAPAFFFPSATQ